MAVRKIMVLQHVGHEPLGTLDPLLKAAGLRIRYVNFAREPDANPSLDSYDGLIILGGPMGVYEANNFAHLKVEMRLIEEALKRNLPVLGICLGAQLIASVLGGDVKKAPRWEFGWCDIDLTHKGKADFLFENYKPSEKVFQIHQDTFTLPKSVEHLASSSLCEGQAFRYNENVYGLQFHLEADYPMIKRWLNREENQRLMLNSGGLFEQAQIEKDTQQNIQRSLELSGLTFSKIIEIFGPPEKKGILLGSKNHIEK